MSYAVRFTRQAAEDLQRLYDFVVDRELEIPFGASGYVALFEIEASDSIVVAAVRHRREDDCH